MTNFKAKLLSLPTAYFIFLFIFLSIVTSLLLALLTVLLGIELPTRAKYEFSIANTFKSIFLAPLLETFLLQYIPIELFRHRIKNDTLIIVLTGVLFGSLHYFNEQVIIHAVLASFGGFILSVAYILSKERKDDNSLLVVAAIHSGYNLFVLLLSFFAE